MSAKKFLLIYLIAMIPTYWWRWVFVGAVVDLRVNEGLRLTQSSQDSISLVIDGLMLISYSIMFYACKKRGETVGKNYLIVFPILGGVFDVLIPALFVPTICSLLAMVLGFIDSKSTSHSISPTQVANQTDPVAETVYEQALDLSSDAYKIYLVKKYQVEKNHALAKFICRDRLFESIDQALQHAHELERQQKDNLEADAKNKQKRLELAKSLGIEEQDFGQGSTRLAQGYKVLGQKFYDLEDAIAYVEQQSDDERKAQATLSILNKPASRSLDLPLAQDAHKTDETQQPTVLQENYSWRREEAAVDSQRKKSKNTLPIFLGVTVIVAAVFWRLGSETGGTTEKKDTVKPSTSKPYSQLRAEMGKKGWKPYITRENKDQCDLKYQEVNFCSEDLSCTAEFLDGSNLQIAKINFRICKSAINNCVSWGDYPDGFELVVSEEFISRRTPVETYACDL